MRQPPARQIAYGEHPDQVGNLHLPAGEGPWPVVILIHGGNWRWGWDRTLMTPLARDLAARGIAAWNVEYRRVGQEGGGWPGTFADVAAAADAVADLDGVDPGRAVAVGHSAGGQLALWLAARSRLAAGLPGAVPRVAPLAAVSQAGYTDLARAVAENLGDGACRVLLGGTPAELPERYAATSPVVLLPLGVPVLLVHGEDDVDVPPSQSQVFADAARAAGDVVELVDLPGADHFDVIEPGSAGWAAVVERLPRLLARSRGGGG